MFAEVDRSTFAKVERGEPSNGTILSSTLAKKSAKIVKNRKARTFFCLSQSQSRKIGVRKPSIRVYAQTVY
jgi:hypothetical protein